MDNLGVLVGYGFDIKQGGQDKIAESLKKKGYDVMNVNEAWPRNEFVYFNGKYVFMDGSDTNSNPFGNGGMVQKGKDFVLVSDGVLYSFDKIYDRKELEKNPFKYKKAVEHLSDLAAEEFASRAYVVPTGNFSGKESNSDIDLFTLLLPDKKIMLFDKNFGGIANNGKDYNAVAEKEGFDFIDYDGRGDNVWYPLNASVLKKGQEDLVVLDSNSKSLMRILDKKGVDFVPVDMPQKSHVAGKLNCQTNTFNLKDKEFMERFFS